jgi:hypothetical protein
MGVNVPLCPATIGEMHRLRQQIRRVAAEGRAFVGRSI